MNRKTLLIVLGGFIFLILLMGGGFFMLWKELKPVNPNHKTESHKTSKVKHDKPPQFSQIKGIIVKIPASTNKDDGSEYLELSLSFSTYDEKAPTLFESMKPVIEDRILSILSKTNGSEIKSLKFIGQLRGQFLDVVNKTLLPLVKKKNDPDLAKNGQPDKVFVGCYITHLIPEGAS